MLSFAKSVSLFLGAAAILYLFTCSTFISFEQTKKNINRDQLVKYVLTEVDIVSLGEITHSPRALDLSLEIRKVRTR